MAQEARPQLTVSAGNQCTVLGAINSETKVELGPRSVIQIEEGRLPDINKTPECADNYSVSQAAPREFVCALPGTHNDVLANAHNQIHLAGDHHIDQGE